MRLTDELPNATACAANQCATTCSMTLLREVHTMSIPNHSSPSVASRFAQRPAFAVALSLVAVLALSACGKTDDGKTVGQKVDAALEKTEQAAAVAKAKTESVLVNAGVVVKDATQKGEVVGKDMANKAEEQFGDLSIATAVKAGLARDTDLSALKINVDSKNGVVLLKGTAPTPTAKERASEITKAVKGVSSVNNQLVVKPN